MIDNIIYFFTFLFSNTIEVILWGWWFFFSIPVLILKWVEPVVAIASGKFILIWVVISAIYKLKKTWNTHFLLFYQQFER